MKPSIGRGDKGQTDFRGKRISKSEVGLEAIGTIDSLNSFIGLTRATNKDKEINSILEKIQDDLFTLGADLATGKSRISSEHVKSLENTLEKVERELKPLTKFILPTGCQTAALLHVARTVCRRAERTLVTLAKEEEIGDYAVPYLNRLSDLLFALARLANKRSNVKESEWK